MTAVETAPAPLPPRPAGLWRALARGARVFAPVIVLNAVVQIALIADDPTPDSGWRFALLAAGSAASILCATVLVAGAANAAVDLGAAVRWRQRALPLLSWTAGAGFAAAAAAVLLPLAAPVLLLAGALLLPAAAAGHRNAAGPTLRALRRQWLRYLLSALGFMVAAVVSWVVALLLGLFVTGLAAAGLVWLWFGAMAALWCCVFAAAFRRAGV